MKKEKSIVTNTPPYPSFISCGYTHFKNGDRHVRRIFPAFVMMFVYSGAVYLTEDDIEYKINEGECFIQTPGLLHYGCPQDNIPAEYFWIHFLPQAHWNINSLHQSHIQIQIMDTGIGLRPPVLMLSIPMHFGFDKNLMKMIFKQLHHAYVNQNFLEAQAHFDSLLNMTLTTTHDNSHIHEISRAIQAYILAHNNEKIDLIKLSNKMHYSCDYLSRCFKETYNKTIIQYINQVKLEHVINLLLTTSASITQIAASTGYDNPSVFIRWFKNNMKVSPLSYRKKFT